MNEEITRERVVVAHRAGTATEAMVIRSLLQSSGIDSPGSSDMLPMREPPKGFNDADILVLESQAEEAQRIIEDYLRQGMAASKEGTQAQPESGAPPEDDAQ